MQNTTNVLIIVLVVVLVLILFGGFGMMGFGVMGGGMMNRMMGGFGGYGFNPLGAIISIVFWLLILGGVVLLVVWLARNSGKTTGASTESALDILKARYAKGEITKNQFDAMKRDLGV
jgi:putative membrane protein